MVHLRPGYFMENTLGQAAAIHAMGKNSMAALPVPHDSTVALLRKLGGREGKDLK